MGHLRGLNMPGWIGKLQEEGIKCCNFQICLTTEPQPSIFPFSIFFKHICLAPLGLRRSTQGLPSSLQHSGSTRYDMQDLVPWPEIEPGPPALGSQSLSHWTPREDPSFSILQLFWCHPMMSSNDVTQLRRFGWWSESGWEEKSLLSPGWGKGSAGDPKLRWRSPKLLCGLRPGISLKESQPSSAQGIDILVWFLISRPWD